MLQWRESQFLPRSVPMSRCRTNISHPTKFSSSKTCQSRSRRISLWHYSPSAFQSHRLLFWLTFLSRYPNLYEVRLIPTKKDIAFVEFVDEASATTAKEQLHNYKLDGENKIKVGLVLTVLFLLLIALSDYLCQEINSCRLYSTTLLYFIHNRLFRTFFRLLSVCYSCCPCASTNIHDEIFVPLPGLQSGTQFQRF